MKDEALGNLWIDKGSYHEVVGRTVNYAEMDAEIICGHGYVINLWIGHTFTSISI